MSTNHPPYKFETIAQLHRVLELPKPRHPMISVIDFEKIKCFSEEHLRSVSYNFYCVAVKKNFEGKMKYGQNNYDFDEGLMTFFAPGQVITTEINYDKPLTGWWLVFHPDFIRQSGLGSAINNYSFFSYAVHEALHLSTDEGDLIEELLSKLRTEYSAGMDNFSQDVIISYLELILNYCNRFYNRQFITRKHAGNDLLSRSEALLSLYFSGDSMQNKGLPTVQFLAEELNVSPKYLSDMLKANTGLTAQQHIHTKLIEKASEALTTTALSVSEIAYMLGFEYPQSFSKLFKNKTTLSPVKFRSSFN